MVKDSDKIEVSIRFPIKISVITAALALALIFLHYYFTNELEETLVFCGAALAAGGAVLAAFYTGRILAFYIRQEQNTERHLGEASLLKKQVNALRFGERWNEPAMGVARKTCREIAGLKGKSLDEINELIKTGDKLDQILHLLNFLEEIAVAVEYKVVDDKIIHELFSEGMKIVWKTLELWIGIYRKERDSPKAWQHLELFQMKLDTISNETK